MAHFVTLDLAQNSFAPRNDTFSPQCHSNDRMECLFVCRYPCCRVLHFLNPEKINKNVDGNLFLGNNDLGKTRELLCGYANCENEIKEVVLWAYRIK